MIRREKRHGRRLEPEDVYWLRGAALTGASHDLLAAKFGVSQSTATRAINGDTYAEVPYPVMVPGSEESEEGWAFFSYEDAVRLLEGVEGEVIEERLVRRPRPKRRFRWCALSKVLDEVERLAPPSPPVSSRGGWSPTLERMDKLIRGDIPRRVDHPANQKR